MEEEEYVRFRPWPGPGLNSTQSLLSRNSQVRVGRWALRQVVCMKNAWVIQKCLERSQPIPEAPGRAF